MNNKNILILLIIITIVMMLFLYITTIAEWSNNDLYYNNKSVYKTGIYSYGYITALTFFGTLGVGIIAIAIPVILANE